MLKVLILMSSLVGVIVTFTEVVINQCPDPFETVGAFRFSHPDNCVSFFSCVNGIPYLQNCAPGTRWSEGAQMCVEAGSEFDTCTTPEDTVMQMCAPGSTDVFPNPTECQRYFNCSDNSTREADSFLAEFESECPYPQLFDSVEKICKPYAEVKCGCDRTEFKDSCDYVQNLQRLDLCRPTERNCSECRERFPTCIGKGNGSFAIEDQEYSTVYMVCQDERLIRQQRCPIHAPTLTQTFFSPISRICVTRWEIPTSVLLGLAPTCDNKPDGYYLVTDRPDIFYKCPDPQVFFCGFSANFNVATGECEVSEVSEE